MPEEIIVYLGLGSNLGDRERNIKSAFNLLDACRGLKLLRSSAIIETKPLAGKQQPDYLNCVAEIKTVLSPQALFDSIKQIELSMGREEADIKWASRMLDIDILLFGGEVIKTDSLLIPHSQVHLRTFVMSGLNELSPDFVHPVLGEKISVLHKRLNGGNFSIDSRLGRLISVAGAIGAGKTTIAKGLSDTFGFKLVKEAYETNPFMKEVYAGRKDLALDSQLFFLLGRCGQLNPQNFKESQIAISDYIMDQELVYAKLWLNEIQFELYKKINYEISKSALKPTVVIYLKASAAECLKRIYLRNRPYEQGLDIKFLEKLCGEYDELFEKFNCCPVITVDANTLDFRNSEQVKQFGRQINYYIGRDEQ
ncbi:MAG: 2-amino-4-hydroxy-6-hydroxymethyldihydropteridine diphosphokinase [Phycisphaerae bacterium]|nr:2-amino-4-hydroxy-6-hydroxymethyldihydropteridine diphosphokinase [Phycisphaerae bacterium]